MGDIFLDNDAIIRCPSVREEPSLIRPNDDGEKGFDFVDNDFGHQFVASIAEPYWSVVFEIGSVRAFRDETQAGGIQVLRHLAAGKDLLIEIGGCVSNLLPEFLVEHGVEAIRSRGLKDFKALVISLSLRGVSSSLLGTRGVTLCRRSTFLL